MEIWFILLQINKKIEIILNNYLFVIVGNMNSLFIREERNLGINMNNTEYG